MPRRQRNFKKRAQVDPRFKNDKVNLLINRVMVDGKKHIAQGIVYNALDKAAERLKKDPMVIFDTVLTNITPIVEVKSRRIGGASYQIPTEIAPGRRLSLAFRWLVQYSRARTGVPMEDKLTAELVDAFNNTGTAVKKKEDTHKMADANKALAHYSKY
ncbi:30S ribosomal protein S7 [Candidatus Wirthbacteria bacterium CG2_30_54_11]|uniref:Small ribosomal subunit protein uS7 n=1 Tax=Candidatus Wirthbacteria bacterium CG2_30_54_11 TaxID=1817892 RepID=A0A1J5ITX2_9BACT|nr:MAG: 30S ribosomal protein S7 [Candidatus Wirthbacteria bacterium CG2_30_54_11]